MENVFAPTKQELLSEHPEQNEVNTYRYQRFIDSAYWTAIYMAYRKSKANPIGAGIAAWEWYYDETEKF